MPENLKLQIIHFCAPVIAGLKPAGMFSVSRKEYPYLTKEVRLLNKTFNKNNLFFFTLCRCVTRELLFIYNKKTLAKTLNNNAVQKYLIKKGYSAPVTIDNFNLPFQTTFMKHKEFPHEVGIFLGYPLEDVIGFEKNNGKYFKCSVGWKVYGNVNSAYKSLLSYEKCTNNMMFLYTTGKLAFEQLCYVA